MQISQHPYVILTSLKCWSNCSTYSFPDQASLIISLKTEGGIFKSIDLTEIKMSKQAEAKKRQLYIEASLIILTKTIKFSDLLTHLRRHKALTYFSVADALRFLNKVAKDGLFFPGKQTRVFLSPEEHGATPALALYSSVNDYPRITGEYTPADLYCSLGDCFISST